MRFRLAFVVSAATLAPQAHACPTGDPVITQVEETGYSGHAVVEVLITNDSDLPRSWSAPDKVPAHVQSDSSHMVTLRRSPDTASMQTIPPKGFARAHYSFPLGPAPEGSTVLVSIPAWKTLKVAVARTQATDTPNLAIGRALPSGATSAPAPSAPESRAPTVQGRLEEAQNEFLGNFSPYEASYIAFGNAKDSEWRVQLSFKYRILGSDAGRSPPWSNGLYFAFTNRLFWDIASDASFRDTNYAPELFYRTPEIGLSQSTGAGIQFGLQHESNGRAGKLDGRSVNNVYVSPTVAVDLGDGYRISAAPRLSLLVGGKAGNPDILTYRGATSLGLRVGKDDGLMLTTSSRYNFASGKGAVSGELSYPLPRILGRGPQFYLFVQGFTGYGESLRDYDRRMSRLRTGLAITR